MRTPKYLFMYEDKHSRENRKRESEMSQMTA